MDHDISSKKVEKLFVAMESVFREYPLCADATVENINCTLEITLPHKFILLNGTKTKIVSEDAYYLATKELLSIEKSTYEKRVKSKSKFVQKNKSG